MSIPTERECRTCHVVKPLDQFRKSKLGKYGRTHMCKACNAAKTRARRTDPKVKAKERAKQSTEESRRNARERQRRYRERQRTGQKVERERDEYTEQEIADAKAVSREHSLEYSRSERGKKVQAKYRESDAGRETKKRYKRSANGKEAERRYNKSDASKEAGRRFAERNPEKIKAHGKLNYAIKTGKIIRPDVCSIDNTDCYGRIEAHHPDYSKPLDVVWLCKHHHSMIGKEDAED